MSLTKFVSIKNIGRFQNYNAAGDVVLKQVNLVFAENGRGKSTLCAILRSAQSNDPAYVLGRATLGSTDAPNVMLLTDSGTVNFKAGVWTQPLPHLTIFDATFIAENVFSGDAVDLEHRRNLYRVIIGKQGVKLAQQVNDIDAKIRTLTSTIKVKRAAVEGRVPSGFGFDAFTELAVDPTIDEKIAAKEKELEAVQESTKLRARSGLSEVNLPIFPVHFGELLERTISDLSAEAERRVAEHLAAHEMERTGERWIQEGLGYIRGDACPFCNQPLGGVDLIGVYQAFFDDTYNELKEAIASYVAKLNTLFGDRAIADVEKIIAGNEAAAEFWIRYCNIFAPQLSSPQGVGPSLREIRDAAITLLDRKSSAPLDIVRVDQRYLNASGVADALLASVTEYNDAVRIANTTITSKKATLEGARVEAARIALKADEKYPVGDFRSLECIALLKEADIVVTNPPFSLFREYVAQLVEYGKKFLVIGNVQALTYKEVFPLIKANKLWMGVTIHSGDRESLRVNVRQVLNVRSLRGKKGATLFIANSPNQISLRTFASVRKFIFVKTGTGVTIGILI